MDERKHLMSTPMYDIPDHMVIPLNAAGQGPADGDDFDHWGCWCGDSTCTKWEMGRTILDVAQESCGESNPLLDNGAPCVKFAGHAAYAGVRHHVTANGIWWED